MSAQTSWIFTITSVIDAETVEEATNALLEWLADPSAPITIEYENDDTGEHGGLMLDGKALLRTDESIGGDA